MLAGVPNSRQSGSNTVLLTQPGGGTFGNAAGRIHAAIERSPVKTRGHGLDVRLVSHGPHSAQLKALVMKQ